jgi:hypothetical protein
MNKTILVLFAMVNFLVAVIAAAELWDFSKNLDRPGRLEKANEGQKTNMLRTLHYWGFPPVILLTAASGVVLWKVAGTVKA